MDDINFPIKENHDAKKQALLLIKELPKVLPLERAKMRIKLICKNTEKAEIAKKIIEEKYGQTNEETKSAPLAKLEKEFTLQETIGDDGTVEAAKCELVYLIMPHLIRDLTEMCNKDEDLSFEEIEHYVYSRLITQEEQEAAQKEYEESLLEKAKKANEEIDQPKIIKNNEELKADPIMKKVDSANTEGVT